MDQRVYGKTHPKGYVTLLTVLILSVIGTTIAVSLLVLSTDNTRTALVINQSTQARALADTCIEVALQKIRATNSYTGTATTTFSPQVYCVVTVTSQGGQTRTLQATGTSNNVVSRVQVLLTRINPTFTLTEWQEKTSFN